MKRTNIEIILHLQSINIKQNNKNYIFYIYIYILQHSKSRKKKINKNLNFKKIQKQVKLQIIIKQYKKKRTAKQQTVTTKQMQNQVPRPNQLTNQFIKLLHEANGIHQGYFQIIQFHQKRQKYYSTHISDGYFKCKVIFRQKPSKQIDKGQIKLFSILHGNISNQGNRILMVFNQLKVWDYPRTVGIIRNWRYQSVNIYLNGSNYIHWVCQDDNGANGVKGVGKNFNQRQSQDQEDSVLSCYGSQINLRTNNNNNNKNNLNIKNKEKNNHESANNLRVQNTISLQNQVFSFAPQNNNNSTQQKFDQTQSLQIKNTKNSDNNSNSNKVKNQPESKSKSQIKKPRLKQQIKQIRQSSGNKNKKLLIVAQSQSQNNLSYTKINKQQNQLNTKQITNTGIKQNDPLQQNNEKQNNQKSTPKIQILDDELDIFEQMQAQVNKLRQKKYQQMIDQSTQDIFNQLDQHIKNRNNRISSLHNLQSSNKNMKSSKEKVSTFSFLFQSDQVQQDNTNTINNNTSEKPTQYNNSSQYRSISKQNKTKQKPHSTQTPQKIQKLTSLAQFNQLRYQSQQKPNSYFILPNKLSVSQLNPHDDYKCYSIQKKWITVIILCFKFIQQGNCSKLLVVAQEWIQGDCGVVFNIVLNGADMYNPFVEGYVYQLSMVGVNINQPSYELMYVQAQLRANSQQIKARKIKNLQPTLPQIPHFCYIPLQKIQQITDNKCINITAVVHRCKNISKKKNAGWINIFTLINPFTGSNVDFTIFDAHKLTYQPGSPVIIFNASVKTYQGKKQLYVKNYTFYYFGKQAVFQRFQKWVWQVRQIKRWVDEGNTVANIMVNNQNYRLLQNLLQTQIHGQQLDQQSLLVQTPIVQITKISPYYFRLKCDSCNKKLIKNTTTCFDCGKRQNPYKQFQLSIQVSDNSHSCFVEFGHYDSIQWIGQECQRVGQFVDEMMHRRVRLWLQLNPKYRAQVNKMEVFREEDVVAFQFQKLKEIIKYI